MSIEAAAKELTKEIDRLLKKADHLTKLRDALPLEPEASTTAGGRRAAKKSSSRKSSAKADSPVKKNAAKTLPPAKKKRTMSPEGRKAIAEATKRRWALKRKADAAAEK